MKECDTCGGWVRGCYHEGRFSPQHCAESPDTCPDCVDGIAQVAVAGGLREAWSAILVDDYDSTHVAIVDDAVQVLAGVDVKALREAVAMDVSELIEPDWRKVETLQDLARQVLAALWKVADNDA